MHPLSTIEHSLILKHWMTPVKLTCCWLLFSGILSSMSFPALCQAHSWLGVIFLSLQLCLQTFLQTIESFWCCYTFYQMAQSIPLLSDLLILCPLLWIYINIFRNSVFLLFLFNCLIFSHINESNLPFIYFLSNLWVLTCLRLHIYKFLTFFYSFSSYNYLQ